MFSWGNGEYGALGFGNLQSIQQPTPLFIRQNGVNLKVRSVVCGSMHSMCITSKQTVFSWGNGKQGRLGHGNENDILLPSEIQALANQRVIQVSAGESHCAALSQINRVYIWGNGAYGRLGLGFENQENFPAVVEDLSDKNIVRVSCGTFHTIAMSEDGKVYTFGHNKYGKLGINARQENTVFRSTQS